MDNHQINSEFLSKINPRTKAAILANIAKHYGITSEEAYIEVSREGAEHLTEYVTGPERSVIMVLMNNCAAILSSNR